MDLKHSPPKQNLTVRVDGEIIEKCKKKNLNISRIVRLALELALDGKLVEPAKARKGA